MVEFCPCHEKILPPSVHPSQDPGLAVEPPWSQIPIPCAECVGPWSGGPQALFTLGPFLTSASNFSIEPNGVIFDVSPKNDGTSPNVKTLDFVPLSSSQGSSEGCSEGSHVLRRTRVCTTTSGLAPPPRPPSDPRPSRSVPPEKVCVHTRTRKANRGFHTGRAASEFLTLTSKV